MSLALLELSQSISPDCPLNNDGIIGACPLRLGSYKVKHLQPHWNREIRDLFPKRSNQAFIQDLDSDSVG